MLAEFIDRQIKTMTVKKPTPMDWLDLGNFNQQLLAALDPHNPSIGETDGFTIRVTDDGTFAFSQGPFTLVLDEQNQFVDFRFERDPDLVAP